MNLPLINVRSVPILCKIDEHIRQHNWTQYDIHGTASDVCDGHFYLRELRDLIRRDFLFASGAATGRYLRLGHIPDELCGRLWTVDLTEKALVTFWPIYAATSVESET